MNAHTTFDEQAGSANLPAMPVNIADFCDGRDEAIRLWLERYDTFHAMGDLAGTASLAGSISIRADSGHKYDYDRVSPAFCADPKQVQSHHIPQEELDAENEAAINGLPALPSPHGRSRHHYRDYTGRQWFERVITHEIDRRCWYALKNRLGVDELLDRQAKEEFEASLKGCPPPFTPEICEATFGHYWLNRKDIYLRGLANVFKSLDRRFRSHDAFAIGNRVVIDRCFGEYGSWQSYNRRDTILDIERVFREIDEFGGDLVALINAKVKASQQRYAEEGRNDGPGGYVSVVSEIQGLNHHRRTAGVVEGAYFKARTFLNGNCHLWFTRKDLLKKVNELLLEYFKPLEGDVSEDGPSHEAGPLYHQTPAKNFGAFFTSEEVAELVMEKAAIYDGKTVLEPSAGSGVLARAARKAGGVVTCIEIQDGLAHELRVKHRFPETLTADFLTIQPHKFPTFDRIIMNPPFDRGRDCDHVRHAFQMLKPGGILVAIMSARAEFGTDPRHKALHAIVDECNRRGWHRDGEWIDLPEKSFAHAGTNVNTVMLKLIKREGKW